MVGLSRPLTLVMGLACATTPVPAFLCPWRGHPSPLIKPSLSTVIAPPPLARLSGPLSSTAGGAPASVEPSPEVVARWETMLKDMLQPGEEGQEAVVEKYLDECDYFFMGWLANKVNSAPATEQQGASNGVRGVMEAINQGMQKRLVKADLILRGILRAGDLKAMENALRRHFKHGDLDMAFTVLLGVNIQKALADSDDSPAAYRILEHLNTVLNEEREKKLPPAARLFKKLMRTDDKEAREKMLKESLDIRIPGQPKVLDLTKWGSAEVTPEELRAQITDFVDQLNQIEGLADNQLDELCNNLNQEIDEAIAAVIKEKQEEAQQQAPPS